MPSPGGDAAHTGVEDGPRRRDLVSGELIADLIEIPDSMNASQGTAQASQVRCGAWSAVAPVRLTFAARPSFGTGKVELAWV